MLSDGDRIREIFFFKFDRLGRVWHLLILGHFFCIWQEIPDLPLNVKYAMVAAEQALQDANWKPSTAEEKEETVRTTLPLQLLFTF